MKQILDLTVAEVSHPHPRYVLLKLAGTTPLPPMHPGQFVEVKVEDSPRTFLRRPISIHWVDTAQNQLWLLVQTVGDGTRRMAELQVGDVLNVVAPLGRGFTLPTDTKNAASEAFNPQHPLLVGGGVGTAPMLYLGGQLAAMGITPTFLLGARSQGDLLQLPLFEALGRVFVTTEDGTMGEKGYVTQHSILSEEHFDGIYTCGPGPMMRSVARYARQSGTPCEVSLENHMACGLGACLCCVEKTIKGNVCVCKEGPVFNINQLNWE